MRQEQFSITGKVRIEWFREDGTVEVDEFCNLVVTAGKTRAASRLASNASAAMNSLAVGTGANAAAAGDTTLQTEIYRESCTVTPSGNTVQYQTTLAAGEGTGALTEAGIFDQNTIGGTMFSRVVFAVKNKSAGEAMTITWTLSVN